MTSQSNFLELSASHYESLHDSYNPPKEGLNMMVKAKRILKTKEKEWHEVAQVYASPSHTAVTQRCAKIEPCGYFWQGSSGAGTYRHAHAQGHPRLHIWWHCGLTKRVARLVPATRNAFAQDMPSPIFQRRVL
ncbi:hypothetical protein HAX54_043741 [Datura stramonium]|uniref:Uncharacterized protein n=1 Tax=Datura stramonium TaxID=4076 RepID=A0ABS8W1N9_DATST|nr:hypothetical protein [Datura stramonium]